MFAKITERNKKQDFAWFWIMVSKLFKNSHKAPQILKIRKGALFVTILCISLWYSITAIMAYAC